MVMTSRSMAFAIVGLGLFFSGCASDPKLATNQSDGSGGGGNPPDGSGQGTTPQALPFAISDYFTPSGFMGDGEKSATAIVVSSMTCKEPRPTGAVGDCYQVKFTPGALGWAGAYWQYPENNWGANPGKRVEAGATKVSFFAAGAVGGEPVEFIAGGESNAKLPYQDSFKVMTAVTLTTAMTPYHIDISDRSYDSGVLGAFAWTLVAPPGSKTPIIFYLDSVRWEK